MAVRVGLAGLGIMGSAYAGHLLDANFDVAGFDIDADALERFRARGGHPVASARALAQESDVLIAALPSVAAVTAAFSGKDGIEAAATPRLIVVEAGTFPLDVKERIWHGLEARGARVLDAPVSGTGVQAQTKDLVFFASGDRDAFETAWPVLEAVARDVRYVGAFGLGSKLKFIANLLVTIHNLSSAEALVLAEKAGVDPQLILDVLGDSAATSRMLQVRGPMMARGEYQPASMKLNVYEKDIKIIGAFAEALECPTPLFSASTQFYRAAIAEGYGNDDTAAIADVLRKMAGLPVKR